MDSREKILSAIKRNQPSGQALPEIKLSKDSRDVVEKFTNTLIGIGGSVVEVQNHDSILRFISDNYKNKIVITTIAEFSAAWGTTNFNQPPQYFENVNLAVLPGEFGVAENGAVWITDAVMGDRVLPYITEYLALVVKKSSIVPTLHEAYQIIGKSNYNLGTFIAGPSKTADIEQSLVLGAHGAKSLAVFLLNE